jgi:hypothetical protein
MKKSKAFIVSFKDLIDPIKNPDFVLSPEKILKNPKIKKKYLKKKLKR